MTSPSKNLVLRIAFVLSLFDAVQMSMGRDIWPGSSPALLWLTAWLTPFAFYWCATLPARFLPGSLLPNLYGITLFVARMGLMIFIFRRWQLLGEEWQRLAAGLVIASMLAFAPIPGMATLSRRFMNLAVVPGVLALLAFLAFDEDPTRNPITTETAEEGAPNIVLISWDTVRADVLPMYGGSHLETPHLSALAERSLIFDDAVASAPITAPSHATMLTVLLPPAHGLRSNVLDVMSPHVDLVQEILQGKGYRTGGFVSAYPVLGRFGFSRGFEIYDDRLAEVRLMRLNRLNYFDSLWMLAFYPFIPPHPHASTPGPVVHNRIVDWLEEVPTDQPFFLFQHLYDAHGPNNPQGMRREQALDAIGKAMPVAVDERCEEDMAFYRAEIQVLDDLLGELLAKLEERDPGLENTLILVTSDHGECFGEGGILSEHVPSLYEATQHVPMILHLPGGRAAGRRVAETVTHYDLLPTFLAEAGMEPPASVEYMMGVPLQLAATERGLGIGNRTVYMEAMNAALRERKKQGWRTPDWKYIHWESGVEHLWAYRQDEVQEHLEAQRELATRLHEQMMSFFEFLPKVERARGELSEEDMAALKALGYAD